jgi:hypothetical protein
MGSGFGKRESILMSWDGDAGGMPALTANAKGSFKTRITVPKAAPGQHTIAAAAVAGTSTTATVTSAATAETVFTISGPEPSPTAAPTATPAPTVEASATPSPTAEPTTTPTASPLPSSTPSTDPTAEPTSTPTPPATVSGVAYRDLDRDGLQDQGDAGLSSQTIILRTTGGSTLATTTTDDLGRYGFTGVTDGTYEVAFGDAAWRALRADWVPTTTGSYYPRTIVTVSGGASQDFGWRPIVRSADVTAPIDVYVGPSGLRVETFNDVVPPEVIYDQLMLGLVGAEARFMTIRFDVGTVSSTSAGWQGTPGSFSNFSAVCYGRYAFWLDGGDQILSHEYGHAWSYYYDVIVQQDSTFSTYLAARGLADDPRVGSNYRWLPSEMIAEDYRQLFGSPNARSAWQDNWEIPPADQVPGLRDFFLTTYMQPPGA